MKKLFFTAIMILLSYVTFGQTWNKFSNEYIESDSLRKVVENQKKIFNKEQKAANWNFKLEDGKVYWQKVFEHPIEDSAEVRKYFENNPLFNKSKDGYTASIALSEYSNSKDLPFILNSPADMVFYVQYKEGKYRVTLTNSIWTGKIGGPMIAFDAALTLNDMVSKSGKFRSGCKDANICLLNLFNYKSPKGTKGMLNDDF